MQGRPQYVAELVGLTICGVSIGFLRAMEQRTMTVVSIAVAAILDSARNSYSNLLKRSLLKHNTSAFVEEVLWRPSLCSAWDTTPLEWCRVVLMILA